MYEVPSEEEFFLRGFGLSDEYDEGIYSFIKEFGSGSSLIFTHSPYYDSYVEVKIYHDNELVVHNQEEEISSICFQTWSNNNVIRVYLKNNKDFLVYYNPAARVKSIAFYN